MSLPTMGPVPLSAMNPAANTVLHSKISDDAGTIPIELPCREYLKALVGKGLRTDAIKFLAAWLPPRESIWFGCLGVWQVYRLLGQPGAREILDKITDYIKQPTEEKLAGLGVQKELRKDRSTMGMLAQAVIYSGNNISPYPKKPVKPKPSLVGITVANALIAAASKWPGKDRNACLDQYIEMGLDIAEGKHLWAPNPGQNYPGLREGSKTTSIFEKPRNIWDK